MSITNEEVQTNAEKLNVINNKITMANAELERISKLYRDNEENIATQVANISEYSKTLNELILQKDEITIDIKKLNQDKIELQKSIEVDQVKYKEEYKILREQQAEFSNDRKQFIEEQDKFIDENRLFNNKVDLFNKEKASFDEYKNKVLEAINAK